MSQSGTNSFILASIALHASRQSFFQKLSEDKQIQNLKKWADEIFKKCKKNKLTEDDIVDIFSDDENIEFTENGEIRVLPLDPDKEILDIMESMNKKSLKK